MTVKEQAYAADAYLHARGAASLKRSHMYELLAAAVGYSTYAAFQHDAIWCDVRFNLADIEPDLRAIRSRCRELGLPTDEEGQVVDALPQFLNSAGYAPVRFDALVVTVEGDEHDPDWHQWVWTHVVEATHDRFGLSFENQQALMQGLEAAAQRGVPAAHLAIAKLLEPEAILFGDEEDRVRRQVKREGTWTSPYVSFVDIAANGLRVEAKHRHHLLAAARGGDIRALMETAERYGDPAVLELAPSNDMDPISMCDIASRHGDGEKMRYWLTIAAQEGDVGAMLQLILDHDEPNEQAWVWMYLSRLLEHDLSQDRHVAVNQDGTLYDDDIGGPAFLGGDDGIELNPLSARVDASARQAATKLFTRINQKHDCAS